MKILHMVEEKYLPKVDDTSYIHESLESQGFIHCSTPKQVAEVANYIFSERDDIYFFVIDSEKVGPEIKHESAGTEELYPHIYGELNMDAVIETVKYNRGADGQFASPIIEV